MITYRKALLGLAACATVLAVASAGVAQDAPQRGGPPGAQGRGPGPGGGGGGDPAMRAQRLHQRLAIRADQEAAFNAFMAATQPPGPPNPQEMQALTTPQRLDRELAQMQRRVAATKSFYAALSPEQRQTFDQTQMAGGPGGRGGRGGPGGQGRRGPGGPGGPGGQDGPQGQGPSQGFGQQAPRY